MNTNKINKSRDQIAETVLKIVHIAILMYTLKYILPNLIMVSIIETLNNTSRKR